MNNHYRRLFTKLAIIHSKLSHLFSGTHDLHDAHFARFDQLTPLFCPITDPGEQLLIGQTNSHQTLAVRKTLKRPEFGNVLVVARTGGGKGLLAIPQLLTWPASVIVNDIKGDLRKHTSGWRSGFSDVLVLDPRGKGNRFDPLAGKTEESELMAIAADILHDHRETNPAFTTRAIGILTVIFLAANAQNYPKFPYVREALLAGPTAVAQRLQHIRPAWARWFLDRPYLEAKREHFHDTFLLHAFGTLKAKLMPMLTETVVKTLSGSDFSAKDIIAGERPKTVYVQWPEQQLTILAPLVRLIMGTLVKGMIQTYDDAEGKGCRSVLVLADEAGRTAIPTLADDAATVRSRGIVLWISVQGLRQLETIYGQAPAETLLNNMDTRIFYRPNCDKTALRLEEILGRKSGFARSTNERHGDEQSEGKSEQAVPLLSQRAIMEMEDEEIIALHRNLPPIRATRMDWRDFPQLEKRRALPPLTVKPIADLTRVPDFSADEGQSDTAAGEEQAFEPVSYEELSHTPGGTIWTEGEAAEP